jgi:hypothetical protein
VTEEQKLLRVLRERLANGECIRQIAAATGLPYTKLLQTARKAKLKYPYRLITQAECDAVIKAVEEDDLSIRAAARKVGVCRSGTHRIVQRRRAAYADHGGPVISRKVAVYRCPKHGLVNQSPCVICMAEEARAKCED